MALISNDKRQPNMDDKLFFFFLSQSKGHHQELALWKQACTDVHLSLCTSIFHTNVYVHKQFYALLWNKTPVTSKCSICFLVKIEEGSECEIS